MSATPARRAALRVLRSVREGQLADRALGRELQALAHRDRAWTVELCQGTLRLRGRLDHALAQRVHRPLEAVDADVLDILRLGAYQIQEMGSVPAYAAVSQSVDLARETGAGAPFVNAVLQGLRRSGAAGYPSLEADPVGYLSTWGSHPRWLVERWIERWGVDATRRLTEANNDRPQVCVRAIGVSREQACLELVARDVPCSAVEGAPDAIRLAGGASLDDALAAAPLIVQDPAAGLVVRYASVPPGSVVADLCAAPGGKAIALAGGRGTPRASPRLVVAADLSLRRLGRLIENVRRLPPLPLAVMVADAQQPALRQADVVLIDVPCTGTGTLRRHPDGRWRLRADDLSALVRLQARMLEAAAAVVIPGGLLVYATCSLEQEENELQIDAFLDRHSEFAIEPPGDASPGWLDSRGRLSLLPHIHGFDGAFAARLRRRH